MSTVCHHYGHRLTTGKKLVLWGCSSFAAGGRVTAPGYARTGLRRVGLLLVAGGG